MQVILTLTHQDHQAWRPCCLAGKNLPGGSQSLELVACQASVSLLGGICFHPSEVLSGSLMLFGLMSGPMDGKLQGPRHTHCSLPPSGPEGGPGSEMPFPDHPGSMQSLPLFLVLPAAGPWQVTEAAQLGSGGEYMV